MLIDWFTVAAQVVNFLLIVYLLKRFLYQRLLNAIDQREKAIADRQAEAEEKRREADARAEQLRLQCEKTREDRDRLIAEARQQAESQRIAMLQEARDSVRALETKWHEDLDREKRAVLDQIRRRAASEILAVTERALSDLANTNVQQCATRAFLERVSALDPDSVRDEALVLAPSGMPEATRREIEEAIHHRFGEQVRVNVERSAAISWGLELRSNGHKIGWTPETYVDALQEKLRSELERRPV
jgi:F-type H+-transporting ATPase subunit b